MTKTLLYVGGQYDYGDKSRGLSHEHRNIYPSLQSWCRKQGWEIRHYDFFRRGQEIGLDLMTEELYELVRRERPAFLFSVLFDFHRDPHHQVFAEIGKSGETTTIQWFCDDHWRFEKYSRHVTPHFHYVTTTASSALPKYAELGLSDHVIKTQWACNHDLYVPHDIAQDIDVSFVGMPHGDRIAFLNSLIAQGLGIEVFGHGWQDRPRLPFHQMVRLFSRSKVNLNLSNSSTLVGQQIKGRNFEVPGAGGFLLSGHADNLGEYYQDGKEIVTYTTVEELADKAKYYLAHDTERRRIAEAGYRRTLAEHTWHHRYDQIFGEIARRRVHAPQAAETASVLWQSPLWEATGWAEEARSFVLALDSAITPVAVAPVAGPDIPAGISPANGVRLERMAKRSLVPGGVAVSHGLPTAFMFHPEAGLNIGRTMFETDSLPDGWAERCNQMDQIWVPSEFNRETFARAGVQVDKIRVIPAAIDTDLFDGTAQPLPIAGARGFNFLSIFDWTERKGWDLLIRAYVEEFGQNEDVALIVKPSSSLGYTVYEMAQRIDDLIATLGHDPAQTPYIILEATDIAQADMPSLYRAADCYVLPTRGEGWGRPYMEAMAMGLPTIGTEWGGNRAFMTETNSYLIRAQIVPVSATAAQEQPMYAGQRWAAPDVAHLRQLMRRVFTDRAAAKAVGAQAQADVRRDFSPARIAALMRETLQPERQLVAA